jgi:hypothetical protein
MNMGRYYLHMPPTSISLPCLTSTATHNLCAAVLSCMDVCIYTVFISVRYYHNKCTYFKCIHSIGARIGVQTGSTRHVGHWMAYCTWPGWLWWWSNWWNEDWQGRPKYSEKTCPNATLSTTNPIWPGPGLNPGRRSGKPATNHLSYGATYWSRDSAVSIMTDCGLDGREVGVRVLLGMRFFSSPHHVYWLWSRPSLLASGYQVLFL